MKIENFLNSILDKNMVTPFDSLVETKPLEQSAQTFELDVRIGFTHQDMLVQLFYFAHT